MLKPIFIAVVALFIHQQVTAATIHGNPVDYKVFQSSRDSSYGVRFVEPVLCDPNVVQVYELYSSLFFPSQFLTDVYSILVTWIWALMITTFSGSLKVRLTQKKVR